MNQLLVPVSIRNSSDGKVWYARTLTHDASSRGNSAEKALSNLEHVVKKRFREEPIELVVRSIDMSFPMAKSIPAVVTWMKALDDATATADVT